MRDVALAKVTLSARTLSARTLGLLALTALAACGSVGRVEIQVGGDLNPLRAEGRTIYRAVEVKLFLLEEELVTAFDGATSKQLWPEPGKVVELGGVTPRLLRAFTAHPKTQPEPIPLVGTEDKKYSHLGVTANFPDPGAQWLQSYKLEDVRGNAIRLSGSKIELVPKGSVPPAGDGR